uniref:Mutator-like transposase domain-containing protein n=1 Tax=Magallana gigas TaxID=29159 RepID=A0A8W8LNC7_MAGGI
MRVVDKGLTLDMINDLYISHARCKCQLADFEIKSETKWGLGWSWTFGCKRCNFISKPYKLYHEVPSEHCGRKAAEMNLGIQTGLYQTPLGNDQARLILACTGIPPPARGITSRHKMGQGASQVIGVACEDETDQHNVMSYHMVIKLCWVGAWLRGEGYDVSCRNGHVGCTANKNPAEPLSERETGYKIGENLAKHDLLVKYVTTDGDATSCAGLETALQNTLSPL